MNLPTTRAEAAAKNEHKYFTGKPCSKGHISKRYTQSGTCEECIRANVVAHNQQRHAAVTARAPYREHLSATPIRVSAENYRRVLELAFSMTRIRYPSAVLDDVERKKGGKDAQGGLLLYTLHLHPEDIFVVRSFANSLIPRLVDIDAERARIFGGLMRQADAAACPEPALRS